MHLRMAALAGGQAGRHSRVIYIDMASAERRPPVMHTSSSRTASAMSRTVSNSSSVSHMDLQIKHHWNDAVDPSTLIARSVSPMPVVSDSQLQAALDTIQAGPSSLSPQQKEAHLSRLSTLDLTSLSQEKKADLHAALSRPTRDARRKGIVDFIRSNDGVVRWAASLRSLVESHVESVS